LRFRMGFHNARTEEFWHLDSSPLADSRELSVKLQAPSGGTKFRGSGTPIHGSGATLGEWRINSTVTAQELCRQSFACRSRQHCAGEAEPTQNQQQNPQPGPSVRNP
jgi:hypothetical protein